ncbi:MAG: nicotinate phosphoribosyltransferase [Deltaproteobacteria bacterium]|nr:nicotinate phosphoribosyltransferase [Deltaproteobacteria bacterium]
MALAENFTLLTDLYQLTMGQAYFREGRLGRATFSLFIRSYPLNRGYFVSAGLKDVIDYLQALSFDAEALDYLAAQKFFSAEYLHYLSSLKFTGDLWAIPEGRIFFADEPIVEITAPIVEAQLVETFVINQMHLQTLIATKAARCVHAAARRPLADFALRRAHGSDAGMKVARASFLAGFAGTSNVRAGQQYGIPLVGTMAHSFIMSFEHEVDAFRSYVAAFPNNAVLLIDTYDSAVGAQNAVIVAKEMASRGEKLIGVRIDSGDLAEQARIVRKIFDAANLPEVKIIGSGGLDEYDLAELSAADTPFDSYGVGTKMGTSADAPWSDMSYKLVAYEERATLKLSTGKASWPGPKQIYRSREGANKFAGDVIGTRDEELSAEKLLQEFVRGGEPVNNYPSLAESRKLFAEEFAALPESVKALRNPARYPVTFSEKLNELRERTTREVSDN